MIVCAQPSISGLRSDLVDSLQPLSQEWNAGCSFVCTLHIYVNVYKAEFVHKWGNQ